MLACVLSILRGDRMRLRRSTLNVSGNMRTLAEKSARSNVDVVMIDLEDAILESMKDAAREETARILREVDFGNRLRCVRINQWGSEHALPDVKAVLAAGAEEIKMTKCELPGDVLALNDILADFERDHALPGNSIGISLMIESPLGVMNAYALASCCERITSVSLGAGDIASSLGVDRDTSRGALQLLYVKQKLALCAHAAGVHWVLDTSFVPMPGQSPAEARETLRGDCLDMKKMGFTGRSTLTPDEVEAINEIFSPTPAEIEFSRKVAARWGTGLSENAAEPGREGVSAVGEGALVVDGRHIDEGKANKAMRVVALADAIERRG